MINVGIIGCGGIAQGRHIPAYHQNPATRLRAFYDPVLPRAQELAARYGGVAYGDLGQMLADPELEAVSICTPEALHMECAIRCIQAKKHVLCEKPMALNAGQAQHIKEAADKSGRVFMVAHNQRIYEPHWKAKELIESGAIGRVLSFRTFLSHNGPEYAVAGAGPGKPDEGYFDRGRDNGGVMLSVGCHRIDLIPFLFGKRITRVMAHIATLDKKTKDGRPIAAEDTAMVLLECEGGLSGMLYTSWCNYGDTDRQTHIFGTEGVIKTFEDPYSLVLHTKVGEKTCYDLQAYAPKGSQGGGAIVDAFVESIAQGKPPLVSAQDGLQCMRVLDAIQLSGETGQWVTI